MRFNMPEKYFLRFYSFTIFLKEGRLSFEALLIELSPSSKKAFLFKNLKIFVVENMTKRHVFSCVAPQTILTQLVFLTTERVFDRALHRV